MVHQVTKAFLETKDWGKAQSQKKITERVHSIYLCVALIFTVACHTDMLC